MHNTAIAIPDGAYDYTVISTVPKTLPTVNSEIASARNGLRIVFPLSVPVAKFFVYFCYSYEFTVFVCFFEFFYS